ncbi:ABC transporter substrate-binding protein [Cellulosimicrobium arenosum]|uniref:Extracellular solute-binding protein n=1 Tax=Cellulosimicrobium arenosum TaxID=2708133 RepID=A0A927J0Z8_9MICO|nr:extracellular solute-binding protein [Cellulosimicrobium arenosum]MBD8079882.1 extracellular solute-binding protein [Cellulosimicrobium arenosum]
MTRNRRAATVLALGTAVALVAGACSSGSGGDDPAESGGDVTLTWWHNSNNEPGKGYYEQVAEDFEADHDGVTIDVQAMAHEDMLTKLDAAFQTGDTPDVYMERGGGELADHVEAGLTMDLSEPAADTIENLGGSVAGWQVEDKTYALPFSVGVVGFWYNKAHFEDAGITEPPTSQEELDDAVQKLKDAGVEPISVGAGDKWPAAHYWYYYAVRQCSQDVLADAVTSLDFSDPCFLRAGEDLEAFIATEPFNAGFLATPAQTGPTSASGLLASGKVAMELAGHWEPGVMQGLTEDGTGLGDDTGWFAFPTVQQGEGDPTAALGGGDAWACSAEAPPECVDFIEYLLSDDVQIGFAEQSMGLPTNPAASGSVADPALADLLTVRDDAPYVQLYLDTAFGENVGGAMNDTIALMFAGEASPQDIVDSIQSAAGTA